MKTAGDYLFVADCEHNVDGEMGAGALFVYKKDGEGAWELSVTLEGAETGANFAAGFDVKDAVPDTDIPLRFAVGAPGAGLNGVSAGGADKGSPWDSAASRPSS
jgi:hypothetical protein